jgi:5-methylcytosine-specific restriction endonuclease McrA
MKNANRKEKNQGMNWIAPAKRLAIYHRDGLACAYCAAGIEDGAKLTLDHLKPYSKGGSNHETNLVTCCATCNSSRGNRSVKLFAAKVAAYRNVNRGEVLILAHIKETTKRELNVNAAKAMIAARGGFSAALRNA